MTMLAPSSEVSAAIAPVIAESGKLFDLQLLVARRADALAQRRRVVTRAKDRRLWLKAESEVFDRAKQAMR